MSNRCRRCNRELSNADALYGWRCAEIMGIAETATKLSYNNFVKLVDGILKADKLFKNSNIKINDTQMKAIYAASIESELLDEADVSSNKLSKEFELILGEVIKWTLLKERVKEFPKKFKDFVDNMPENLENFAENVYEKADEYLDNIKTYFENVNEAGLIDGTSKNLAKAGKLDDISTETLRIIDKLSVKEAAVLNKDGELIVNSKNKQGVDNYKYNSQIDMSEYTDYIDTQTKGNIRKLKFGNDTMNYNGCEVIATYNALVTLGAKEDIRKIAAHYESDGQLLNGTWGTNPYAAERFFKQRGYEVSRVEGDDILHNKLPSADAYIVSFWNTDKVTGQLHTVAARKDESGEYILYNYNEKKPSDDNDHSLQEIIAADNRQPILLLAINKNKKD